MTEVVADTSPLVALHQISLLGVLRSLFGVILIPEAVAHEAISVNLESWIEVMPLRRPIPDKVSHAAIGRGETEAISLALEVGAGRLIVDVGSSRVDLQACKLEYSIVSPK